jgi:hypothetical protein
MTMSYPVVGPDGLRYLASLDRLRALLRDKPAEGWEVYVRVPVTQVLTTMYVQCLECQHLDRTAPGGVLGEKRCAAYPFGMPLRIAMGRHDHREPYPDDRGIRFEPVRIAAQIAGPIPIETDGREATKGGG